MGLSGEKVLKTIISLIFGSKIDYISVVMVKMLRLLGLSGLLGLLGLLRYFK